VLKDPAAISSLKEWSWWGLWFAGCLTIFTGRAAILTVLSVSILLFLVHPLGRWYKVVFLGVLVVGISFVFNIEQSLVGHRAVSPEGVMRTFQSIFSETGLDFYDGSRFWRLEWWREILDYTVFGDYFWTGKGYGVNLADDDGFQVLTEGLLRSPHNSHLTFLARSGVPGFAAWLLLQGTFSVGLWTEYRRARRLGRDNWAVLNLWILCYWLAFMINGAFDVFLEGPQGGIWFWCVFGFGMGVLEVQRRGEWSTLNPPVRGAA
jgi:O-antigen ligase